MFEKEDFVYWGEKMFERAKEIKRYELAHKTKVVLIIEALKNKYSFSDDEAFHAFNYHSLAFDSFLINDDIFTSGEVKYYWLNYILNDPYSFENTTWKDSIEKIIEDFFTNSLADEFNKNDFYNGEEFRLTCNENLSKKVSILVPYSLQSFQVEFAIQLIEKLTKSKVSKIFLFYFTDNPACADFYYNITIAIDDNKDKFEDHPCILSHKFLNHEFSSSNNWFREVSEFESYINVIDSNTFECPNCGGPIYKNEEKYYYDERDFCLRCGEYVELIETVDNIKGQDIKNNFSECKKCGDSNDVIDTEAGYWWCKRCEHYIDHEGNCISNDCKTCENDKFNLFNEEDGHFYLFFDTETTGVPKDWKAPITSFDNWPRIVQIAWLIYDCRGNQIKKNEFVIKPSGFEIPTEASNVHGITTKYAFEAGSAIKDALIKFEQDCEKSKYLIAHNINFDSNVLGAEFLRTFGRNPLTKIDQLCTMEASTDFCKIPGKKGYKWPKLSELHIQLFGVNFEDAHNALADVEATAKCYWEMKRLELI